MVGAEDLLGKNRAFGPQRSATLSAKEGGKAMKDQLTQQSRKKMDTTETGAVEPKPARGFLWWGLFLTILTLSHLFSTNFPPLSKAVSFFGLVLSVLLCVMWFQFTKIRLRRPKLLYVLGTGVLFIGTLIPPIIGEATGMVLSSQASFSLTYMIGNTYPIVLLPAVLCTVAYFLHFRSKASLHG